MSAPDLATAAAERDAVDLIEAAGEASDRLNLLLSGMDTERMWLVLMVLSCKAAVLAQTLQNVTGLPVREALEILRRREPDGR